MPGITRSEADENDCCLQQNLIKSAEDAPATLSLSHDEQIQVAMLVGFTSSKRARRIDTCLTSTDPFCLYQVFPQFSEAGRRPGAASIQ